jgi:hypothetical protein
LRLLRKRSRRYKCRDKEKEYPHGRSPEQLKYPPV